MASEKAAIRLQTIRSLPEYSTMSRAESLDSTATITQPGYSIFSLPYFINKKGLNRTTMGIVYHLSVYLNGRVRHQDHLVRLLIGFISRAGFVPLYVQKTKLGLGILNWKNK